MTLDKLCQLTNYAVSRSAFRESAMRAGAELQAVPYPALGPGRNTLFVDVARLGPADAENAVVVVTGLHGVEGPCGSVCLVDALESGVMAAGGRDLSYLLIHSINPWGYAWLRRTNERGVDLNRNFAEARGRQTNAFYQDIQNLAVPPRVTTANTVKFLAHVLASRIFRGRKHVEEGLIGGQTSDPFGMYYVGNRPEPSIRILSRLLKKHTRKARRVAYLDVHSGLGDRGVLQLLHLYNEESPLRAVVRRLWPNERRAVNDGDSIAFAEAMLGRKAHVCGTLEFGTLDEVSVLLALRADHALHKKIGLSPRENIFASDDEEILSVKGRLANAFSPRDDSDQNRLDRQWTETVADQFRALMSNLSCSAW